MKFLTNKKMIQKTVIAIISIITLNFCVPTRSYCTNWEDVGGKILKEVVQFVVALGDVVVGGLNNFMLGADNYDTAMLNRDMVEYNLRDSNSAFFVEEGKSADVIIENGEMDEKSPVVDTHAYEYPNMLYSPESIFGNKVGMLDVNFLNPNKYTSVTTGETVEYSKEAAENYEEQDKQISAAAFLSPTIASWYRSFRNIAIVGLLTVLVYVGIRILISSTAADKAKYKESLKDWVVALCLVFIIHIIMSGILMLTDQVNNLFASATNNIVIEDQTGGESLVFKTNLMGLVRFRAQAEQWQQATAYSVIYMILIFFTIMFTYQYLKRFLWMAFLTMIAPLVALTYPIDRAGDRKSTSFSDMVERIYDECNHSTSTFIVIYSISRCFHFFGN